MKALLLDADGVILTKGEFFSVKFAREYNVPLDDVLEFFKGPFGLCQKGEADLKEVVLPYLERWKWEKGLDAFLTMWFEGDFHPNTQGITTIQALREKGVACYMASNNERYRATYIKERLEEAQVLDGYYFSWAMKYRKSDPQFFQHILTDLQIDSADVYFVDNDQKNVDTAIACGIQSYLYSDGLLEELLAQI